VKEKRGLFFPIGKRPACRRLVVKGEKRGEASRCDSGEKCTSRGKGDEKYAPLDERTSKPTWHSKGNKSGQDDWQGKANQKRTEKKVISHPTARRAA